MITAAVGIGLPLAHRLDLDDPATPLSVPLAAGLGMAVLAAGGQLLGMAGLFLPEVVRWCLAPPLAFGMWSAGRRLWGHLQGPAAPLPTGALLPLAALGLLAAALLALTLPPVVFYDALLYHLGSPAAWLLEGSTLPEGNVVYTGFPMQAETLLAEAMALGGPMAGPVTHGAVVLLLAATAGALATRHGGRLAGLAAALLTASLPMTAWLTFLVKPEVTGALYALLAAAILLEPRWGPGRALGLGLFLALSAAAKPTNALYVGLPMGIWLLASRGNGEGGHLRRIAWAGGGALLGAAPWMARDLLHRLVNGQAAGLAGLPAEARQALLADLGRVPAGRLASAPLRALLDPVLGGGGTGSGPAWQWLALLPLALLAARERRWVRPLLAAGLGALLLRAATYETVRFGYAAFPLLAVAAAGSLPLPRPGRGPGRGLWAAAALLAAATSLLAFARIDSIFSVRTAFEPAGGPRRYLARHLPALPAFEWIDAHTPAGARVLLVGETRRFHLKRRHGVADFLHANPFHRLLAEVDSPPELRRRLVGLGFTHLLLHPREETRLLRKFRPVALGERERRLAERFYREEVHLLWSDGNLHLFDLRPDRPARP